MSRRVLLTALVAVAFVATAGPSWGQTPGEIVPLGVIKGPSLDQAKTQALAWLKDEKCADAVLQQAEALWDAATDRPLLDRTAETLALGCGEARKLVAAIRDDKAAAPTAIPEVLKNPKCPAFFRGNLGLYYARALVSRRVHEEALEVLKAIRPESVVDPASYYFFRAVAEHKLHQKQAGLETINRLLDSIPDAPERYLVVATLMKAEMQNWKDEDLGDIARRMDNIERRLDLARGGPKTQAMQKEVIAMLDKMIEDLEKQC